MKTDNVSKQEKKLIVREIAEAAVKGMNKAIDEDNEVVEALGPYIGLIHTISTYKGWAEWNEMQHPN